MPFDLLMLRALALFVAVLAACTAAVDVRPWTLVADPRAPHQWFATWPGVKGISLVAADNASTAVNGFTVSHLLDGHSRMTGLAAWQHADTGDLLLYVASYDDHRVWRYQLDARTGASRGQLQMVGPDHPMGLALFDDGDTMCVSGELANARVVQCYRIQRRLDADGVSIDEWWVMMANYQWERDSVAAPQPKAEAMWRDPRALAIEGSPAGSLWIDTKERLIRFPLDSITGAYMPQEVPVSLGAERLTLGDGVIVAPSAARRVTWQTQPTIQDAEPLHEHTQQLLRAVIWRQATLSDAERVRLHLERDARVERQFNRLPAALAQGEVSPSATVAPTPSVTALPTTTPSGTVPPSGTPTPTATASATQPIAVSTADDNDQTKAASGHASSGPNTALWGLSALAVPLCFAVAALTAVAVYRGRRQLSRTVPGRLRVRFGAMPTQDVKPMIMRAESSLDEDPLMQWERIYDTNSASSIAMLPPADDSRFDGELISRQ